MLDKSIKRFALLLILVYFFLSKSGYTAADIFAERKVVKNKLTAVTLDLSVIESFNNLDKTSLFDYSDFQPRGYVINTLRIKSETTGDYKYEIRAIKKEGDENFCRSLKIKVLDIDFNEKYDGDLLDFALNSDVRNSGSDDWIFMINFDDDEANLKNKFCRFDLDVKTYYDTANENSGIFAQKIISNVISSGNW